jgi:hypothetical protein
MGEVTKYHSAATRAADVCRNVSCGVMCCER